MERQGSQALPQIVEAILFVADTPVEIADLAKVSEASTEEVEAALAELADDLEARGLRLQRFRDQVQLVTAPQYAPWVERFLGLELSSKLSTAALETLAIIAYQQPITRAEIDAIRGVNSSGTLRTLIQRELVEEVGRLETVGNPYLYATTPTFLQYFGLSGLDELPPLSSDEESKMRETGD
ncbi:MAG: SMC-Scp complex subunit ScpB [Chloroflexota bacterium]|nr:SMC-Scp complex subunit ScpB [Chloroflexota bacterium]